MSEENRNPVLWIRDKLPKDGEVFPEEGDLLDCSCGQRMIYVVISEEEGCGFSCHSCGESCWCWLDEETGSSYWEDSKQLDEGKK